MNIRSIVSPTPLIFHLIFRLICHRFHGFSVRETRFAKASCCKTLSLNFVMVLVIGIFTSTSFAQFKTPDFDVPPRPVKPAATSYPSFAVQGEYQGWMLVNGQKKDYALQVVGTGEKKVRAVLLIGRLPGLGTYEFQSAQLKGKVEGNGDRKFSLSSDTGVELEFVPETKQFRQQSVQGELLAEFDFINRTSETLGMAPPADAKILFDGQAHELQNASVDDEGYLQVGTNTEFTVGAFRLHIEFKIPYQPTKSQQGRGNSGVYIQRRYELQILDSFGEPNRFNYCGSLYRQRPPAILMSLPPEQWQTYDIWFTPAKWQAEQKVANARITLKHNGVTVHDNVEILAKTGAGQKESPKENQILLQDHGDPVKFRNVWIQLGEVAND